MLIAIRITDNDISSWSTLVLAAFTAVIVVINIRQSKSTSDALEQARRDTQEAIKARIDARAPLVVVVAESPGAATAAWPTNSPEITELDPTLVVGNNNQKVGITGWFRIENQGISTAIVDTPEGVIPFPKNSAVLSLNAIKQQRPYEHHQFVLEPKEGRLLFVQTEKTVTEWKEISEIPAGERGPSVVRLVVEDTFSDGISDVTELHLHGVPIHETPVNGWIGAAGVPTKSAVARTVRTYPNLQPQDFKNPWWRRRLRS